MNTNLNTIRASYPIDVWTITCALATVVSTGLTMWQHAVVKNGRTIAFFSTRDDAEKYVDLCRRIRR